PRSHPPPARPAATRRRRSPPLGASAEALGTGRRRGRSHLPRVSLALAKSRQPSAIPSTRTTVATSRVGGVAKSKVRRGSHVPRRTLSHTGRFRKPSDPDGISVCRLLVLGMSV